MLRQNTALPKLCFVEWDPFWNFDFQTRKIISLHCLRLPLLWIHRETMCVTVTDTQASAQCHFKREPAGSWRKCIWLECFQSGLGPTSAIHHPLTWSTSSFAPTLISEIWRTGWESGVRLNQMAQALYVLKWKWLFIGDDKEQGPHCL